MRLDLVLEEVGIIGERDDLGDLALGEFQQARVTPEVGMGAIRYSLRRGTTREEIDAVAERLSGLPETAFTGMSSGKAVE